MRLVGLGVGLGVAAFILHSPSYNIEHAVGLVLRAVLWLASCLGYLVFAALWEYARASVAALRRRNPQALVAFVIVLVIILEASSETRGGGPRGPSRHDLANANAGADGKRRTWSGGDRFRTTAADVVAAHAREGGPKPGRGGTADAESDHEGDGRWRVVEREDPETGRRLWVLERGAAATAADAETPPSLSAPFSAEDGSVRLADFLMALDAGADAAKAAVRDEPAVASYPAPPSLPPPPFLATHSVGHLVALYVVPDVVLGASFESSVIATGLSSFFVFYYLALVFAPHLTVAVVAVARGYHVSSPGLVLAAFVAGVAEVVAREPLVGSLFPPAFERTCAAVDLAGGFQIAVGTLHARVMRYLTRVSRLEGVRNRPLDPAVVDCDLACLELARVPANVFHADHLVRLDLSRNLLARLPKRIRFLRNLKTLNLAHNALEALPPHIGRLTTLRDLNLAHNKLTALPKAISRLQSLRRLNVAHNSLPDKAFKYVGRLRRLTTLNACSNEVTQLPPSMAAAMTALRALNLGGNPLHPALASALAAGRLFDFLDAVPVAAAAPGGRLFVELERLVDVLGADSNAADTIATRCHRADSNAADTIATRSHRADSNAADTIATRSHRADSDAADTRAMRSHRADRQLDHGNSVQATPDAADGGGRVALVDDAKARAVAAHFADGFGLYRRLPAELRLHVAALVYADDPRALRLHGAVDYYEHPDLLVRNEVAYRVVAVAVAERTLGPLPVEPPGSRRSGDPFGVWQTWSLGSGSGGSGGGDNGDGSGRRRRRRVRRLLRAVRACLRLATVQGLIWPQTSARARARLADRIKVAASSGGEYEVRLARERPSNGL